MRRKKSSSAASLVSMEPIERRLLLSATATTTTLSITPTTTVFGQEIAATVTVTTTMGTPVTTGLVEIFDNGAMIASGALTASSAGQLSGPIGAAFNASGGGVFWTEPNVFTAQYADSTGTYAASESADQTETVNVPTFNQQPGTLRVAQVQAGSGAAAASGQSITIAYAGYLTSGVIFDSSAIEAPSSQDGLGDLTFTVGSGSVIPGIDDAVVGMLVNEIRVVDIPASLAYGANPPPTGVSGVAIPANAELVFVVKLESNNSVSGSSLVPTITKSTLPASVVAGAASQGSAIVDVQNTGSSDESGTDTIAIYASSDGSIDSSSTSLGSLSRKLLIKAGKSAAITVPIKSVPATLNGTYTLLAQVTDSSKLTSASSTGPSLTAAAPFIQFSDTFIKATLAASAVSGQKTNAIVQLKVTNNGNITSTGTSTLAVYASPDSNASDGTLIRSEGIAIPLRPGASRTLSIPLRSLPLLSDGEYYLVAQLTDPKSNLTSAPSSAVYTLAPPVSALVPTLISHQTTGPADNPTGGSITFSIANNGNISAPGFSTITLYNSADGTLANASTIEIQKVNLATIGPGSTRTLRIVLTKARIQAWLNSPVGILQLTDPLGNSTTSST